MSWWTSREDTQQPVCVMSMGWYDSRASNTRSRGAGFEVDGHPSGYMYMYMYMCMYRKRSNYSTRKI